MVEKVDKIRIRVPIPDKYEKEPNNARKGLKDNRFFNFVIQPGQMHIYPDYFDIGNPNTGDDLGLIVLKNQEIIQQVEQLGTFLQFRCPFSMEFHKSK